MNTETFDFSIFLSFEKRGIPQRINTDAFSPFFLKIEDILADSASHIQNTGLRR